jgi:hypothetical protein
MGMEETHHQDNDLEMVMSYDHKIKLANDIQKGGMIICNWVVIEFFM